MARTRAIVITGNGTNCETEAAHACRLGGFDEAVIAHIAEIISGEITLDDFHFLNLTGGFLDGDDLGSAKAQANRLKHAVVAGTGERLVAQFSRFIAAGKLILGVCNGFQLMVKMGMLPGFDADYLTQSVTLTHNDCGRFQDRWSYLKVDPDSPSIYTRGIDKGIYLPVRHGEGKFVCDSEGTPGADQAGAAGAALLLRWGVYDPGHGVSLEPQRLPGGHRRALRPHRPDHGAHAPPRGLRSLHAAPPLDTREPASGGGRADPVPQRGRLCEEASAVSPHR